jgi:hypothetical protein
MARLDCAYTLRWSLSPEPELSTVDIAGRSARTQLAVTAHASWLCGSFRETYQIPWHSSMMGSWQAAGTV